MKRFERLASFATRRREADIGGVRLGQGAIAVDGQPGMEAVVLGLGEVEMRLPSARAR